MTSNNIYLQGSCCPVWDMQHIFACSLPPSHVPCSWSSGPQPLSWVSVAFGVGCRRGADRRGRGGSGSSERALHTGGPLGGGHGNSISQWTTSALLASIINTYLHIHMYMYNVHLHVHVELCMGVYCVCHEYTCTCSMHVPNIASNALWKIHTHDMYM